MADALLPLSILFGFPAVVGLTLGTLVANSVSPFGLIDILAGTAANLVATYVGWKIGSRGFRGAWLAAVWAQTLLVTFIVGSYLAYLIGERLEVGWLLVFPGSFIAMNLGGYALLKALSVRFRRRTQS